MREREGAKRIQQCEEWSCFPIENNVCLVKKQKEIFFITANAEYFIRAFASCRNLYLSNVNKNQPKKESKRPACKQNWILISLLGFEFLVLAIKASVAGREEFSVCLFEILKSKILSWRIHVDVGDDSLPSLLTIRGKIVLCPWISDGTFYRDSSTFSMLKGLKRKLWRAARPSLFTLSNIYLAVTLHSRIFVSAKRTSKLIKMTNERRVSPQHVCNDYFIYFSISNCN